MAHTPTKNSQAYPPGVSGNAVIYFLHARFGILFKVRHFVINDILI